MSEFLKTTPESHDEVPFANGIERAMRHEEAPAIEDIEVASLAAEGLSEVIQTSKDENVEPEKEDNGGDGHDDTDEGDHNDKNGTYNDNIEDEGSRDDYENDEADEDYDDDENYYDDDDDYYYDDYYEQHYGDERENLKEENLTLRHIPLPPDILQKYDFLSELPQGIAVMGGVARSIAREIITGDHEPIRDIDLVNILDEDGDSQLDYDTLDALSMKYMPDDYEFGHGIGDDTLENYFKTRDFTINQSLIMGGELIISDLAYNDFQENIIRPTYYELPYDGDSLSSRLFLKALMMRDVVSQISSSIPLLEDVHINSNYIRDFDIALNLNKAMSRGARTACIFTEDLADWGLIPTQYAGKPKTTAKYLLNSVYSFEFRPSTDERFQDLPEDEDLDGFFSPDIDRDDFAALDVMAQHYSSNPAVRQALAEYEGVEPESLDENTKFTSQDGYVDADSDSELASKEPTTGRYTQADYDEINRCAS